MRNKYSQRLKIFQEFFKYKSGIAGISILLFLIVLSIYAFLNVPFSSFTQWNNPTYWINYPKAASPAWADFGIFSSNKLEHKIMSSHDYAIVNKSIENNTYVTTHIYTINFTYSTYPKDFMLVYKINASDNLPVIDISVTRPDGIVMDMYFQTIRNSVTDFNDNISSGRIFSTDHEIGKKLDYYLKDFRYEQDSSSPQIMIFSDIENNRVLNGQYKFSIKFYLFNSSDSVIESSLILGGKKYGLLGIDEMRRDLSIGLLWGTPIALFIGITVSIFSIFIGLFYGVFAGYRGKRTDEGMMRINDIFYSLPTLPLLIILSIFIGRSIFLLVIFIVFFSWMGTAKISRSLALQIKNLQYVEASKLMGQSEIKIIFKHIIPQLLPFTFASIAISVPGAILAEAALSFIGLGDPSLPTWGQILHEANSSAASSRGLWWWILPPGIMIALTGLAFVMIGNTLESIVNPKKKIIK